MCVMSCVIAYMDLSQLLWLCFAVALEQMLPYANDGVMYGTCLIIVICGNSAMRCSM